MGINIKVSDGKTTKLYHLEAVLNIGRSSKNDIIIKNPKVSKFHAQIIRDLTGRIFVKDMFSLNGTVLNSGHVTMEPVFLGDIIYIADFIIMLDEKDLTIADKKKIGRRAKENRLEITMRQNKIKNNTTTTNPEPQTKITKVQKKN